jgi:hypothetical protein
MGFISIGGSSELIGQHAFFVDQCGGMSRWQLDGKPEIDPIKGRIDNVSQNDRKLKL